MSKKMNLEYEGSKFTLEMNRDSVRNLEANGFRLSMIEEQPMTMIPMLVYGAFSMHHPRVKKSLVDEIYHSITDKGDFVAALMDMYGDTLETLTAAPEEGTAKNVSWKMS
ncbi:MAG: DUF5055 domain-containing protein [Firmicutes bacterium]|nr:DUF5055 domain-containing protein [Bacillota bacterium]